MSSPAPEDSHVVVFDVNVYLDVARLLGTSMDWETFRAQGSALSAGYIPHWSKTGEDSLVALFHANSGFYVPGQPLTVWSSDHIEKTIAFKAQQPSDEELEPDDRGLGWSGTESETIFFELHDRFVPTEQLVEVVSPAPPDSLGREDGLVLRTAWEAGHHLNQKYCVTKDTGFLDIGDPSGRALVISPHNFVQMLRESRRAVSGTTMPRPRPSKD